MLYPLGLRQIHIFIAVAGGELFHHHIFYAAVAGKKYTWLRGRNKEDEIEKGKERNKVDISITVGRSLQHVTKIRGFAESFAPFTVFFAPFAAFVWTDSMYGSSFVNLKLQL